MASERPDDPQVYNEVMALFIPPGFSQAQLLFEFSEEPQPAMTTVGLGTALFNGTEAGQAQKLKDSWVAHMLARQSNVLRFKGVTVRVGQAGGEPTIHTVVANSLGTNVAAMVPRNSAALVQKGTALGGRKHRGRMYLPGMVEEAQTDQAGNMTATHRQAIQTAFDTFRSASTDTGLTFVVLHSDEQITGYNPNTGKPVYGPVTPPPPTPITSFVVATKVGTQRRRLR